MPETFRRLLLTADIVGYSAGGPPRQATDQAVFRDLLAQAAEVARLDHDRWDIQESGDGVFAVLPSLDAEPRLVGDFVRNLHQRLREKNATRDDGPPMRLRLSAHTGPLAAGANGYIGKTPIVAGRLVDAAPVRTAIATVRDAQLALIVSDEIYQSSVATRLSGWRPEEFREVSVVVKKYRGTAWLIVPGADVHALDLHQDEPAGEDDRAPAQHVRNVFKGAVRLGDHGVIGIVNR
ncbi:nucleotidyl cyclase domain-containing protein [Nonomuraea gerenzanensis]|uniref:Guanylate cyclase domain-containing protein n=1 Tax=Nonomuraea gerenzanensis TaxID=93944 RepID=A0A1M4EN23_9ACTN|nr:hypothetical protein [Nonomuraea gerenzanensis]UBU11487.1 hypothetical protein LCN96_45415 [Nonomuraea gerenzanensis]SBO99973.1 hypothetical protein BN4615_P9489 [Nonomuraea gerenzanensis]